MTYLRDRLTVARDLLAESGSIFLQIGDENVHRVRALMDEVFGERNCAGQIIFSKTTGQSGGAIPSVSDYLLWYAKDLDNLKRRNISIPKPPIDNPKERYVCVEPRLGELSIYPSNKRPARRRSLMAERPALRRRLPAPASWVLGTPTTCSPIAPKGSRRRPRLPARLLQTLLPTETSTRLRLRARAAHYPQVDRKQRGDRRHLGALAGDAGAASGQSE